MIQNPIAAQRNRIAMQMMQPMQPQGTPMARPVIPASPNYMQGAQQMLDQQQQARLQQQQQAETYRRWIEDDRYR